MMTKHSLFGLMKKISSELFQCSLVQVLLKFLIDLVELLLILKLYFNFQEMITLVISHLVQLTLVPLLELLYISSFLNYRRIKNFSNKLLISFMFRLEASTENIQKLMMEHMIFQIKEDLEDLKEIWYKIWLMVLEL